MNKRKIMKFFVDTADVDDIRDLASTGLVDGVTTNPSPNLPDANRYSVRLVYETAELELHKNTKSALMKMKELTWKPEFAKR